MRKIVETVKTDRFFGDFPQYRNRQKVKKSRVRFFVAGEIFARPVPTGPAKNCRTCAKKRPKLSVCGRAPSRYFALNFTNPEFGRFSGLGRSRVHPYGKCEKLMAKWRDFGVQLAISDGCRASCLYKRWGKK